MGIEKWEDVVGYKGYYQVSSFGRVRSLSRVSQMKNGVKRKVKGKLISTSHLDRGYPKVSLYGPSGKCEPKSVHRIVAKAFIPNPENKTEVNHINGIKHDNRLVNLEWCTRLENARHARDSNLYKVGEKCHLSKLTGEEVLGIHELLIKGSHTFKGIASIYSVDRTLIGLINQGKIWSSVTGRRGEVSPKYKATSKCVENCRGKVFNSATEASLAYGLAGPSHILSVCKGKRRVSGKYEDGTPVKWKYYKDGQ